MQQIYICQSYYSPRFLITCLNPTALLVTCGMHFEGKKKTQEKKQQIIKYTNKIISGVFSFKAIFNSRIVALDTIAFYFAWRDVCFNEI